MFVLVLICARVVLTTAASIYNFTGDTAPSGGTNMADYTSAVDEQYAADGAPILHRQWTRAGAIGWAFRCNSIGEFGKRGLPTHLVWSESSGTFDWHQLTADQLCVIMKESLAAIWREWLGPEADLIFAFDVDSIPSYRHPRASIVEVAFVGPHVHDQENVVYFNQDNVLAHAFSEYVHINVNWNWCIMGSKDPAYVLVRNSTGGLRIQRDNLDPAYGERLVDYVRTNYPNCRNLYSVLLHEIGHVLGLGHASRTTSLMYPISIDPLNYVHASDTTFLSQLFRY